MYNFKQFECLLLRCNIPLSNLRGVDPFILYKNNNNNNIRIYIYSIRIELNNKYAYNAYMHIYMIIIMIIIGFNILWGEYG